MVMGLNLGSQAGSDAFPELPRAVRGGDPTAPHTDQRAGAFRNLAPANIHAEALADAKSGLAQPPEALPQRLDSPPWQVGLLPSPTDQTAGGRRFRAVTRLPDAESGFGTRPASTANNSRLRRKIHINITFMA